MLTDMIAPSYVPSVTEKGWVTTMKHGSCKAVLRRAPKLDRHFVGDDEIANGLPSGSPLPVFPIASLPGCPSSWVTGPGSYVCPVEPEWGLWFDFTKNEALNTAILPSVKGMNPITGQKIESLALEQYRNKCPKHDIEFAHGTFCEKCNYEWPPQNYICHPNIPWWDGFRQSDGCVRQFFFTSDEAKDIASHVIGKENTVPAFGFAFFKTKTPRVLQPEMRCRGIEHEEKTSGGMYFAGQINKGHDELVGKYEPQMDFLGGPDLNTTDMCFSSSVSESSSASNSPESVSGSGYSSSMPLPTKGVKMKTMFSGKRRKSSDKYSGKIKTVDLRSTVRKEVAVGAGAMIKQELKADDLDVDQWKEKESGLIRLYFVFKEQLEDIVKKGGVKDLSGSPEGFMDGLPIG